MSILTDKLHRMAAEASNSPEGRQCAAQLRIAADLIERRDAHLATVETIRDRFAMSALQGLLAGTDPDGEYDLKGITRDAYLVADAMLAVRSAE